MKLLHVVPSYKPAYIYGGPIESIARLCEALVAAGHDVDVFTRTANGKFELEVPHGEQVDVDGVKVTYFTRLTKDPTHISPALWKHLRQHCQNYDVVHIHSWWNVLVIVAALICHYKKAKVIISPRGMLSDYVMTTRNTIAKRWLHKLLGKRALSRSFFHATARAEFDECIKVIPGWTGFTLPNILSLPDLDIVKEKNDIFTIIFLSRIHPKKGLELLFDAIGQLPFEVLLKVAGSGEEAYIEELKWKAVKLSIAKKIQWIGWKDRNEKFVELMNADLLALTSINENFANVVIESLHMGTPVLISDQVGLASFVSENNLGWVSRLNVGSISNTLNEAFADKKKRMKINKTGRIKIQESFSKTVLIQKYTDIYKLVANRN